MTSIFSSDIFFSKIQIDGSSVYMRHQKNTFTDKFS